MADRYISVDKAHEFVQAYFHKTVERGSIEIDAVDCNAELADVIDNIPAADVVEVRHGEWTKERVAGNGYGQVYYQHKNCTVNSTQLHTSPFEYCPRCGAKMDGGMGE